MSAPSSDEVCIDIPFDEETFDLEAQRYITEEPKWRTWVQWVVPSGLIQQQTAGLFLNNAFDA